MSKLKVYYIECEYCECEAQITSQYEPQYCPNCANDIVADHVKDLDEED